MDKKSKETIKEVIEDILELRRKKLRVDITNDTQFFYPNDKSQKEKNVEQRIDNKIQFKNMIFHL